MRQFHLARSGFARVSVAVVALCGTAPAGIAGANDPMPAEAPGLIRDIRLDQGGRVEITLVDAVGHPVGHQTVRVICRGSEVAQARTDARGRVTVTRLRPGVHTVVAGHQVTALRFWDAGHAPPAAMHNPAIVLDASQVRGQYGPGMAPAMLAAGVTATALAVVLIGKNSSDNNHAVVPASP
ncbi:MAG: hypothetical protein RIK87_05245 [Fuerstiella sp.]